MLVTLDVFPTPVTANIVASVLRDHGIPAHVADENAHLYSGAAMAAVPVRVLVSEDLLEEARNILKGTDLALPEGFDPTKLEDL